MLYLLDSNVLITAHNSYYPIDRVPEFWEWLGHVAGDERVKVPFELYNEITDGTDALADWASEEENRSMMVLDEQVDPVLLFKVIREGYAPDLSDVEIESVGRDPFLIGYALASADQRSVVTSEVSKPTRRRANRHVPDVCQTLGVRCIDTFQLVRVLDFRTSWRGGA